MGKGERRRGGGEKKEERIENENGGGKEVERVEEEKDALEERLEKRGGREGGGKNMLREQELPQTFVRSHLLTFTSVCFTACRAPLIRNSAILTCLQLQSPLPRNDTPLKEKRAVPPQASYAQYELLLVCRGVRCGM